MPFSEDGELDWMDCVLIVGMLFVGLLIVGCSNGGGGTSPEVPIVKGDNRGVSSLGFCHSKYNYDKFMSQFDGATVIRAKLLDNTFNPSGCPNLERLMLEPKPLDLEIHVYNNNCKKHARCERHEIWNAYSLAQLNQKIPANDQDVINQFRHRLLLLKTLLDKRGNRPMRLHMSPCLECQLGKPAREVLLKKIKETIPKAIPVDNPLTDSCLPGYPCEKHNFNAAVGSQIVDLDGTDYDGGDQRKFGSDHINADLVYGWKTCNNGLKPKEAWRVPTSRSNFCSDRDTKDMSYWVRPDSLNVKSPLNPVDKNGCTTTHPAFDKDKNFVWKLGEDRNFAVVLFPKKFQKKWSSIEARKNGQVFDTGKCRNIGAAADCYYKEDGSHRLVYDMKKHTVDYPDNVVLKAGGECWVLEKPQFRID